MNRSSEKRELLLIESIEVRSLIESFVEPKANLKSPFITELLMELLSYEQFNDFIYLIIKGFCSRVAETFSALDMGNPALIAASLGFCNLIK